MFGIYKAYVHICLMEFRIQYCLNERDLVTLIRLLLNFALEYSIKNAKRNEEFKLNETQQLLAVKHKIPCCYAWMRLVLLVVRRLK